MDDPSLGVENAPTVAKRPGRGYKPRETAASDCTATVVDHSQGVAGPEEIDVAQHPVIGYLIWALLFGALFAYEGLALRYIPGIPTLSATFRALMRYPFGRWALFALWLWFGWHIFVRGWQFLLRA
jgi:hypothetical protein